jgi:glutathione S-transferase
MDLYYTPGSVNCRSVLLAGKVFDVNFNLKLVNLMAGEHMTPEFLKVSIKK